MALVEMRRSQRIYNKFARLCGRATGGGPNGQFDCFEWQPACARVIYFAQLKYLINRRRASR